MRDDNEEHRVYLSEYCSFPNALLTIFLIATAVCDNFCYFYSWMSHSLLTGLWR